ncbi:MAG: hypothetical protein QCI38_08865, partial [Candidatus Thermoplasmatota archaeon]|nr:hypothetical protein [Candidatus Thermoplasmatota archaeon]
NTFIHRDSGGNLMPNLWGFNNFTISSEKGYMIAINTDGATDFVWELPIWMVEPSAPSVLNLKKGWNAVGFIYTTGAPTPGNIVSGNANIDRTAAWINDQWQNELTVFNNIFEQNCDGLMQTFDASRNAHGFFVRATQAHTWNQGA